MPAIDQLEIIDPAGRIRFYPLNSAKGIANIGRHIDNDIVINRPGVAPFHAMLDHRTRPYHLVVLAQREKTLLDNEPAPINIPTPLNSWASLEIGGHQIIFLAGDEPAESAPTLPPLAAATESIAPPISNETTASPAQPPNTPTIQAVTPPNPTPAGPGLTVEVASRALALDAGQTATLDLTLINGGYKALTFQIAVEGLDPTWVAITPAQLEVPARQRSTVTIAVSPPHHPSTLAGTQTATVTVSTPDQPDWKHQSRFTVTLNPYADFAVSAIVPRTQSIHYTQPFAPASLEIANRGNTTVAYRLSGEDERYACRYEFKLPDESLYQPRQAELRLAPGASGKVAVRVTPMTRYRFGWGARRHVYTVSVAPQGGVQLPRAVLGEVREQPLIGSLAIAAATIVLAALLVLALRPSISAFTVSPTQIVAGQEVTFTWSASPLANLRISPDIGRVASPDGRLTMAPSKDTVYTLVAENFLSLLNSNWFRATRDVIVRVDPVLPSILFTTDRATVAAGESVTLSWQVTNADEVTLIANGTPEAVPVGQYTSSKSLVVTQDTTFVLTARNKFTTADGVSATIGVQVIAGTLLPLPTQAQTSPAPVVDRFEVSPAEITAGQQVTIYWSVSNVDKVVIDPLPGEFPPSGNLVVAPQQTTAYVLTASNSEAPVKLVKQVVVNPAPGAPKIDSFVATPNEVLPGSPESQNIKLSWSVSGETTDIQLAGPTLGPAVNLLAQGELIVKTDATATFTLTAFNGALSSVQTVQVKVNSPAPILTALNPSNALAGATSLTLTVTGSGFVNGSAVQWNGSPRATTFINNTQLTAVLTTADLAPASTANVTVFNPAPGGGASAPQIFTLNNPAPVITSLSPNSALAGSVSFAVTINGSGFNAQTQVRWNGSQRGVSSFSATQLTIIVSGSDVATAGTVTVSVVNPAPGGGSDASLFTVIAPTATATLTPTLTPTATTTPGTPGP